MYNMAQVKINMLSVLKEHIERYINLSKKSDVRNDLNEILFFGKVLGSIDNIMNVFRVIVREEDVNQIFESNLPEYRIVFYDKNNSTESFEVAIENKYFKEA